jgi:serine/threonine protein phosphatase 1
MKYYAIGDVHGQIDALNELLDKIKYGEDGHIIFVGDYVDRGPDSCGVVEKVYNLVEDGNTTAIMGNHDFMFTECHPYLSSPDLNFWYDNYAKSAFDSYNDPHMLQKHVDFIRQLPYYVIKENYLFSHSGGASHTSIADHGNQLWMWNRPADDRPIEGYYRIHGHTPQSEAFIGQHRANLDLGAARSGGRLMCGIWESGNMNMIGREVVDVQ